MANAQQSSMPGPGKRTFVEQIRPAGSSMPGTGSGVAPTSGVASAAGVAGQPRPSIHHQEGNSTDTNVEQRFVRQVREVITGAPEGMQAWNGDYEWDSRMHLALQPGQLTVTVRIFTRASEEVRAGWERAIANKWSGRMDLVVAHGLRIGRYEIVVGVQWVERARDADYRIRPHAPDGPAADGRAGVGGTISMMEWGTGDAVDVPHEFGHMLGNAEDYFTTNDVDHTRGGKDRGYRDDGGGIMNNPAEVPFARHYTTICQNAAEMLGAPADDCTIEAHSAVAGLPSLPDAPSRVAP
jgi:hypothetical protein